jgi:pimeloyl-ACP methyl ester carboxylesterase
MLHGFIEYNGRLDWGDWMTMEFADFKHGKKVINGRQLHYRLGGRGETVVLLHGWPQHSLQWHTVAPLLAERYQVLVPDLPGCGGSSIPRSGFDKRTVAGDIKGLVDALGLGSIRLAGYDHGAGVAYNYASANREAVSHLALMEYVLPGCGYERAMQPSPEWHVGSNWQLALFTVPDVAEFAFRGRERELLTWFFWHGSCNPTAVSPEHMDEYVSQVSKPGALRAGIEYYATVWQDMEANKESMKTKLAMPVLCIGGRHNIGEMMAKAMSGIAETVSSAVIEDAGHWLSDENPAALSAALVEFFEKG